MPTEIMRLDIADQRSNDGFGREWKLERERERERTRRGIGRGNPDPTAQFLFLIHINFLHFLLPTLSHANQKSTHKSSNIILTPPSSTLENQARQPRVTRNDHFANSLPITLPLTPRPIYDPPNPNLGSKLFSSIPKYPEATHIESGQRHG